MKPTILVYCGDDAAAALAVAAPYRDGITHVVMGLASAFEQADHHADRIVFTNDVPQGLRDKIAAAHGFPIPDGAQLADCKMFQDIARNLAPTPFVATVPDTTITPPAKRRPGRPRKVAA